jgi:hypothetical protein
VSAIQREWVGSEESMNSSTVGRESLGLGWKIQFQAIIRRLIVPSGRTILAQKKNWDLIFVVNFQWIIVLLFQF